MSDDVKKTPSGYIRITEESHFEANRSQEPPAHSDAIILHLAAAACGIFEQGDKDTVSIAMEATTNQKTQMKCYHLAIVGVVPAEAAIELVSATLQEMINDLEQVRISEGLPEHRNL